MFIHIRFITPLAATCLGGLAALFLCSALFIPASHTNNERYIANYGKALSAMAAKQAIDATFNHDLVRLQVILQDVVENPHALFATIHDVENKLLVQAGNVHLSLGNSTTYTSPIVLHDSIAGYVSVSIDAEPWSLRSIITLLIASAILLLSLAIWSLYRSKAVTWDFSKIWPQRSHEGKSDELGQAENSPLETETQPEPATTTLEEPQEQVFAVIHIKNLNVLRQQLNGQNFRDTLSRLEKIISDVMALYGGHQFQLVENYYVLTFHVQDSKGEALFHAICSAHLVLELASIIDRIPLDLAALVSANEHDITPENMTFAGLIVEATAGSEALINRRIEFVSLGTDDGRQVVSGFHQPFQSLLENQRKQLGQMLSC
ncbi:hypothetical protein [Agarilytica rhodophyticola]|uniref:hypothetical protein n=1 Tax=Agarilytica rhodophyticola TaxID=1737490 RepID=UPI000B346C54|nr:hypothetical protein [Agarilytica rhodophyticola]